MQNSNQFREQDAIIILRGKKHENLKFDFTVKEIFAFTRYTFPLLKYFSWSESLLIFIRLFKVKDELAGASELNMMRIDRGPIYKRRIFLELGAPCRRTQGISMTNPSTKLVSFTHTKF